MAYLESKKIIHRDLALRNTLVTKAEDEYKLKVTDFGLSRVAETGVYQSSSYLMPIKVNLLSYFFTGSILVDST
jgi:serine/threonine protein kinase